MTDIAGSPLIVEITGPVMIMTLNRPETRNAIDGPLATSLVSALRRLDTDASLLVGVITGNGKGFSSGMDLGFFQSHGTPADLQDVLRIPVTKPLIAAVEGFAVAGGLELALRCDLLVVSREARLGLPEAKVGQIPGFGIHRLLRELPRQAVAEFVLTGDLLTAERAHDLGLITRIVDPGQALPAALELAQAIARNAPLSIAASLVLLDVESTARALSYFHEADRHAEVTSNSDDAAEGAAAFVARRDPVWKGR